jgi:hypothetical protein
MNVVTGSSGTAFAVLAKHLFELAKKIGLRTEVTEVLVAGFFRFCHDNFHIGTIESMESVTLDKTGLHLFTEKNLFKGFLDRRSACAR